MLQPIWKRSLSCLAVVFILLANAAAQARDEKPAPGARHALVVGVNHYEKLKDLEYCGNDVAELGRRWPTISASTSRS